MPKANLHSVDHLISHCEITVGMNLTLHFTNSLKLNVKYSKTSLPFPYLGDKTSLQ